MLIYGKERSYKAHSEPFVYSFYDITTRDIICSSCGIIIGEQMRTENRDEFVYCGGKEKENYKYCPYCGKRLHRKEEG